MKVDPTAGKRDLRFKILLFGCAIAAAIFLGLSVSALAAEPDTESQPRPEPQLHFVDAAGHTKTLTLAELLKSCQSEVVEVLDPYHKRAMRYSAMELLCVLDRGFKDAGGGEGQRGQGLLLRALDGYTRPVRGEELLEPGAFLAFGEPELALGQDDPPRFTKIDRVNVDPGPFYLVWIGPTQNDPHEHPWPYQLSTLEVAPFAEAFPRTIPTDLDAADAGWSGYALFQRACASCHSINGEGGKVGPDLNVPRSIVEYRPIDQIRGYIRNPEATRYTSMPAHPNLSEADLDGLIAYFSAMSQRKDDPKTRGGS